MQPLLIQIPSVGDIPRLQPFVTQMAEESVTNVICHGQSTAISARWAQHPEDGEKAYMTYSHDLFERRYRRF